jgi:hypothetical protein
MTSIFIKKFTKKIIFDEILKNKDILTWHQFANLNLKICTNIVDK